MMKKNNQRYNNQLKQLQVVKKTIKYLDAR